MTVDDQLRDIQARIQQAQRDQARAEADLHTARRQAQAARDALREEFGVTTADDARALLHQLRTGLAGEVATLTDQLDQIEAAP